MTVKELINFLKKQPQDLLVAYQCCSEQVLMRAAEIEVRELCEARPDGWIHDSRDDKPKQKYLLFPGN